MPARKVHVRAAIPAALVDGLRAIDRELSVPGEFPPEVLAAAESAARSPRLPDLDRTDLELVTIDPEGSKDLDQALHLGRDGDGYVVSYAIADVAAFVAAGDPIDTEAHRRGQTLYGPDHRIPLHPPVLSEGAASLLPGQHRPALLWTIRLDHHGKMRDAEVVRAVVRSREQLSYEQVQAQLDGGEASESLQLLREIGQWREQRERDRGGVSLNIPEQQVVTDDDHWRLEFRTPLPVEGWNAQLSLLTGMAAAHIMMYGQIGILRTLPPADHGALRQLRQTAKALRISWPAELDYPEFVRSLDPSLPAHAAMINACTRLFRGAGYRAFSGGIPTDVEHAALAIEYAHCTAPLRRLVDRYAGEVCVALCADQPVPAWVLRSLDTLPDEMAESGRLAGAYERAVIDLVEVFLLRDRVGELFEATIVDVAQDRKMGQIMLREPAVEAKITGDHLPLGQEVSARLTSAEVGRNSVLFELA
ncbi:RNB domain-containing ribonuclease [Microlunatus panaciterrae]|uniref:Exoribonuclease R n=1 Tax=Microlunatus panaciterrae TaxID=400768 RepID=A0ABS2RFW8_9ACTN|nr:RNB domain-containing ribonuclease [Microlunatus panaciterrae]MBM7797900.1 exoribonuclease R [Microlunatus panaciterrae]